MTGVDLSLSWIFIAMHGLSLVSASRGFSLVAMHRLLIVMTSLVAEHRLQGTQARWLRPTGLVALRHVESSWIRDQTCVPHTGRWMLNPWTTEKSQPLSISCVHYISPNTECKFLKSRGKAREPTLISKVNILKHQTNKQKKSIKELGNLKKF